MGACGTSAWGISSWGGAPTAIHIDYAFASSTKTVRVYLTAAPQNATGLLDGDALNPMTWTVQRLDTLEFFTILAVRFIDEPLVLELLVFEPLGDYRTTHEVKSTTLRAVNGIVITAPNSYDFPGIKSSQDAVSAAKTAARRYAPRDIANPPFGGTFESGGGTLVISANGDYALEEGTALFKKLIVRRLTTPRNGFVHLPGYGVGLAVKEPIPNSDLLALQKEIESQVLREPDAESAEVALTQSNGNVLLVQIRAKQRVTGEQIEIGLRADENGVVVL